MKETMESSETQYEVFQRIFFSNSFKQFLFFTSHCEKNLILNIFGEKHPATCWGTETIFYLSAFLWCGVCVCVDKESYKNYLSFTNWYALWFRNKKLSLTKLLFWKSSIAILGTQTEKKSRIREIGYRMLDYYHRCGRILILEDKN